MQSKNQNQNRKISVGFLQILTKVSEHNRFLEVKIQICEGWKWISIRCREIPEQLDLAL